MITTDSLTKFYSKLGYPTRKKHSKTSHKLALLSKSFGFGLSQRTSKVKVSLEARTSGKFNKPFLHPLSTFP